jgi:hypothetical protein
MSNNKMDKIKKTFKNINDYCKEKEYKKCLVELKQIQNFMSKEETYILNTINSYYV